MGKPNKGTGGSSNRRTKSKRQKERNLKKKKKEKFKKKERCALADSVDKSGDNATVVQSLRTLCQQFKKLNQTASPQEIVRAKHKRDQRRLDREMKDICKMMVKQELTKAKEPESEGENEEECIAVVENLSKNIEDLIITNDNLEPGFRFTRWQQRKFQQNIRKQKIKYNYMEDTEMDKPTLETSSE